MEYQTYKNGERTIKATPVAFEAIYKAQGFKPVEAGGKSDKSRGSNTNNSKGSDGDKPKS